MKRKVFKMRDQIKLYNISSNNYKTGVMIIHDIICIKRKPLKIIKPSLVPMQLELYVHPYNKNFITFCRH